MKTMTLIKKTGLTLALLCLGLSLQSQTYSNDFETLPSETDRYIGMSLSEGAIVLTDNPDKTGINTSDSCLQITRTAADDLGQNWAGLIDDLTVIGQTYPFDAATPYMHIMVYKPMVSGVKAKLECVGDGDDVEIYSMTDQTKINEWETLIFDFSDFSGDIEKVIIMPYKINYLDGGDDDVIYLDNISFKASNSIPTGIESVDKDTQELTLSPNPCSNYIQFNGEDITNAKVTITALNGQTVKSLVAVTNQIDVSDLPSGLYVANVENVNRVFSVKFSKR